MHRNLRTFCFGLFIFCSLFGLANCEVGLGPQVDTDTPVIAITAPEIGTSLKQTIVVSGTCGDDNGVRNIEVTLRDADGKSYPVTTIPASSLTDNGRAWSIEVDTSRYSDASYEIVAEAFDGAKRHSSATRSVNIDNTPPVVLFSKPNSVSTGNIDAGAYGGTVALAGEILDDHEITALYIQVYDESGEKITLDNEEKIEAEDTDTWQKWQNFDVQGGVSLTIAQYAESEPVDPTEKLLYSNYKKMYGGNLSDTSRTVKCQIVVVAVDESGNRSTCSYIRSSLNELVSRETGISLEDLRSTKYKTIANGTCPVDNVFTAARQEKIRNILTNISDYSADEIKYASSAEGNRLAFSICADNSPKYVISGYAVEGSGLNSASSNGSIPLEVTYGLDKFQIIPSSLDVTLYPADLSGHKASDEPLFTTKGAAEGSSQWKAIYSTENGKAVYAKNSDTPVDSKTYAVQLPVLVGGTKVAVVVEGEDEAGKKLVASGTYAFMVATTGGAPHVTAADQKYFAKSAVDDGSAKFTFSITDTSGVFDQPSKSRIEITPTVCTGHFLKTNYAAATKTVSPTKTITYNGTTFRRAEENNDKDFIAEVSLNDLGLSLGSESNYTIVLDVVAKNHTEDEDQMQSEASTYILWVDCKGPVIELSNPMTQDSGSEVTPSYTMEDSAYWNRMTYADTKGQEGISDIIAYKELDVSDDTNVNVFSIRGYWGDIEGSGTAALYYQIADDNADLIEDTTLDENLVPTKDCWMKVETLNTTPGASSRFSITNAQVVREGPGSKIAFFAVDKVGNKSPLYKYSKLVFDFGVPTVTAPVPENYYNRAAENVVLQLSASDTNKLQGIEIKATRNGESVTSGNAGYTYTPEAVLPRTDINPLEDAKGYAAQLFDADRRSTQKATITLDRSGSSDGLWEFTVSAKDVIGRESIKKQFSTIIDTVAPSATGSLTVSNLTHNDTASWYKNGTLRVTGSYVEETSGLGSVYFAVLSANAEDSVREAVNAAVTSGNITELPQKGNVLVNGSGSDTPSQYTITPSGFTPGENTLFIQSVDRAGNMSPVSSYTIRLDQISPSLRAEYFTYDLKAYEVATGTIYSNGTTDLVLYGRVSDEHSGVAPFGKFVIGGEEVDATFTYSTEEIEDGSDSLSDEEKAALFAEWVEQHGDSFVAYNASNAKNICTWKAVISGSSLRNGAVKLTAKDVAANTLPQTFFTMRIDTNPPVVEMASPLTGTELNGLVDFRGITADDTAIRSVSLYYSYTSSNASITEADTLVNINGKDAVLTSSESYNWEFEGLPVTYTADDETVLLLGDENYTGSGKTVWFKIRAEDVAGTETVLVKEFIIDPNADRPRIKVDNLDNSGNALIKSSEVYGSVEDDDGNIKGLWTYDSVERPTEFPTLTDDNGWTRVTVTNGSFTALVSDTDGTKNWWFYCIDSAGSAFTTCNTQTELYRPYVSFSNIQSQDVSDAIVFSVDREPPKLSAISLSRAASGTETAVETYALDQDMLWYTSSNIPFGGTSNVMYMRFTVTEASAMHPDTPLAITLSGKKTASKSLDLTNKVYCSHEASEDTYVYTVGPFALTAEDFNDGTGTIAVSVWDKAGGKGGPVSKNIIVDNTAPTVKVEYPDRETAISSTVEISGSVNDNDEGSGVETIRWFIPTKTQVDSGITAENALNLNLPWKLLDSKETVSIAFNSSKTGDEDCILTYANETYTSQIDSGSGEDSGWWDIPIYFLVTDSLGNTRLDVENTVRGDTLSGLPTAEISYPQNLDTVGSTLNISGSATDDLEVKEVWVQFDVNDDGNFTDADYTKLSEWATEENGHKYLDGYELKGNSAAGKNDWHIIAKGTSSWSMVTNTSRLESSGDENPRMGIRARAFDADGNSRAWTDARYVVIDKGAPGVVSVCLRGYRESVSTTEPEISLIYDSSSDIYISGVKEGITWYLEAVLSDDICVNSVKFERLQGAEGDRPCVIESTATLTHPSNGDADEDRKTATLKAKLDASQDGQIYTRLFVYDDNDKTGQKNIRIKIDNSAPLMYTTSGEGTTDTQSLRVMSGDRQLSQSDYIKNGNYVFKLEDKVLETGSGLDYVAFYFLRKNTNSGDSINYDRLYDPMISNADDSRIRDYTINSDGFAVLELTGSRNAEDSFTAPELEGNKHIRKGGLVYIGGSYHKIKIVSGSTVTIDPPVETKYTSAQFVYAQVVDHRVSEGPTGNNYINVLNDDGDGMIESVKELEENTYSWSASIFSNNVPDGDIELHVVAVDYAGNVSRGVCKTAVYNNRPRIAKILLATDLNGNQKFDYETDTVIKTSGDDQTASGRLFGEFVYYSALRNGELADSAEITVENLSSMFVIKDDMLLVPEFVGGNGSLLTSYKVADTKATAVETATVSGSGLATGTQKTMLTAEETLEKVTSTDVSGSGSGDSMEAHITDKGAFYMPKSELGEYESRTNTVDKEKYFAITFWDATEEKTQGKDTQHVLLTFPVIIDTKDDNAPATVIEPFYWNSAEDNSVYRTASGSLMGHIELESDWKSSGNWDNKGIAKGTQLDADPKVSGIIRLQGSARDETRLGKLTFAFKNLNLNGAGQSTEAVLASFVNGEWVFANKETSALSYTAVEDGKTVTKYKTKLGVEADYTELDASPLYKVETEGWSLVIRDDNGVMQDGHGIIWELDIDTQKILGSAGVDCTFTVKAYDAANNATNVAYTMDVVPYITAVETSLSKIKPKTPTVFSRTAEGHYPVYITYAGDLETNYASAEYDTITLKGFNLTGGTVYTEKVEQTWAQSLNNYETLQEDGTFVLPQGAASGELYIKVNGVDSLNNKNNNDARGFYDYTQYGYTAADIGTSGNAKVYEHYYNRQPNGLNNNRLTDDVYLDVWQFNTKTIVVSDGKNSALDVMMKVNPVSKLINFAFCDGHLQWSMAKGTETSYTNWANATDFIQSTGFTVDKNGITYGTAAGGDSDANKADCYNFYVSKWGVGAGTEKGTNSLRIGNTAQGTAENLAKDRFQSSSIVSDGIHVYLAYFDLLEGRICFKTGPSVPASKANFGNFADAHNGKGSYNVDDLPYVQIVADGAGNGLGKSGDYVSLGLGTNAIVMVWYDGLDLKFSYNTNLEGVIHGNLTKDGDTYKALDSSNNSVDSGWTMPVTLLKGAGKYCHVVVDSDDGVHVAAYDSPRGDLKYVYIPADQSTKLPETSNARACTVDSYLSVGSEITIDVAKVGDYQIPYIGYYNAIAKRPGYAYLADPEAFYSGRGSDGAIKDAYTGVWSCSVVPTTSVANSADTQHRINVAVWKTAEGALDTSTEGKSEASKGSGKCYGNGTNNGVLGYSIKVGTGGNIETAQKR